MRYQPLSSSFYKKNRTALSGDLHSHSIAVFNSNDIFPTNADGTMPFRQNNDLFYLTGIDQEETILLLFPDYQDPKFREVLFIKETNENIAIWEGNKLTKDEATAISGIPTVLWFHQFESIFNTLVSQAKYIYLNTNEHLRASPSVKTADERFIDWCKSKYPLHTYERLAPITYQLRAIKKNEEIAAMQQACDITEKGFRRVAQFVKPGIKEYQIEAEYAHEFISNGSKGFAYAPIIASGFNSCVLHYINNDQECKDGDILLMDVGAEYGNYNADMTRCLPVNGRFTQRQRDVYEAVLRVMKEAVKILTPGTMLQEYQKEVGQIMQAELLKLKLLDKTDIKNQTQQNPAYKKYFMHGTSHHIGLDVHDVGNTFEPIKSGMVFTVEPGIYIREESLGIRLENNIVIQENGYQDLMANIPIEPDEIEELMHSK